MDILEITDYKSGYMDPGVNYLQPSDSFQDLRDGLVYRQVLKSRRGIAKFTPRLDGDDGFRRVIGIFEHILPDSTSELLVFDQNYGYIYNDGTNVFDKIPFGGTMVGYGGFNVSGNEFYISGTTYMTQDNAARFVFVCPGFDSINGSKIFFYENSSGTIKEYTNTTDNPEFENPTQGELQSAKYVINFGERLNFLYPIIEGLQYPQGVLFSGIRDSSGNGDKFNVAGSGLLQADTSETINGVKQLGNYMAINFDRSNWYMEKTQDAFNPYFIRKVPGVLGTDAAFSAVQWADVVKSIGKTGILGNDIRSSVRVDNRIPEFTFDDIESTLFELTYGGFDRINNAFMWSYVQSGSESTTQDGVLINNYEFDTWAVYDLRLTVFGETDLGQSLVWNDINETNNPSWARWDTTEEIWNKIGLGATVQKTLAGDDEGFIYQLDQDYDDYTASISGITQASQAVLTIDASAFKAGDQVVVQNVEGMTQINNFDTEDPETDFNLYTVVSATDTSITLNVDSTNFGAYTSAGTVSKAISFRARTIPINPYRSQGVRVYISHVDFLLDTDGGFLKVDVLADEETTPFKSDVLIKPTSTRKNREWVTMSVDNEAEFMTFVLKQNNPAAQVKLTSMRIYTAPGGRTSG